MDRKLAAILAADVVGYSTLMERDEAGIFERLKAGRKELFEPEIALHHGRIFKLMGDGLLAEFSSVVDAVECAVSLQRGLSERNANVTEDQRVQVRIGINLGEVIVDGEDRYGDGVNIAARLEQLAEPGGIWVSAKVAQEVERKLAFGFEAMGGQTVKNIAEPVKAFRVKFEDVAQSRSRRGTLRPGYRTIAALVGLVVLLAAGTGAWYFLQRPAALAREPSIAVLPFTNMSGDPSQDYLGAGIAEDIITLLSSYPTLRVVSRTSSFVYDKPVKAQQVAQDLNVNYLLEGSVRRAESKVRVTAQLIDAQSGEHVWADRYDEEGTDIAVLQDDVVTKLYGTIAGLRGEVMKKEETVAWSKSSPGLAEYDYYLRGHQLFFRFTKEDNAKAREVWLEGLAKFPDSALLRIKTAWTYILDINSFGSDDTWRDTEHAWKLGREAEGIQDKSKLETFLSRWLMAQLYQYHEGDFERSIVEAEAAAKLVPYDAFAHADLAYNLVAAGRAEQAIKWSEDAIQRDASPLDWYFSNLAMAYYHAGRPADAVAQLQKMKKPSTLLLAASYVRLGKLDEARSLVTQFSKDNPDWTLQDEAVFPSGKQPSFVEPYLKRYLADLATAGLEEK